MSVLALGVAGARAQSDVDGPALTAATSFKATVIAARNATCPQGSVDKNGYCADGEPPPQRQAQPPPLVRSPTRQMQDVIQSIQNLKHKCGPTQFWSAEVRDCIENN